MTLSVIRKNPAYSSFFSFYVSSELWSESNFDSTLVNFHMAVKGLEEVAGVKKSTFRCHDSSAALEFPHFLGSCWSDSDMVLSSQWTVGNDESH